MKRILFVCGTGGITSTIAENYVKEACEKRRVLVRTIRCSPMEISGYIGDIDLIVSTTTLKGDYPIPVVAGLNLILGINKEKVIDEVIEKLSL